MAKRNFSGRQSQPNAEAWGPDAEEVNRVPQGRDKFDYGLVPVR